MHIYPHYSEKTHFFNNVRPFYTRGLGAKLRGIFGAGRA